MSENNICPVGVFTEKVGGKWKLSIIYHLKDRKLRFGQLAARIEGVSRKILTDHLKQLEADGLITRTAYKETPPRVEYALTKAAQDLSPLFMQLDAWATMHFAGKEGNPVT